MTAFEPIIAFLDASVLYPPAIRSILLYLALEDLYQPLWSDIAHEIPYAIQCAILKSLGMLSH